MQQPLLVDGIKGGMSNSIDQQKLSVECGYNILMRYKDNEIFIDSREPNFDKYNEFLSNELRYKSLYTKNPSLAQKLLNEQIEYAKKTNKKVNYLE